ncbi:MAG TPA: ATP-binding protein [Kofleriaceae bacterium]|nr:ATP-binding protein [Kofleriaceae bacterium]
MVEPMATDVEILIVDDRAEDLLVIESILASEKYRLVRARSGHDALRRLLERDFAVILVDVVMPGMDGFELATVIKQRERSRYTPIIFLTAGESNIDFIYRGYSVGAVDYLMKPLDADVLRAKVAIFVELFRKDRRIREQVEALHAAERRERELELIAIRTANEQRYRNLAEAIPQIVWTASEEGSITYFNRRWYEYTGQTTSGAKGWGWMSAISPDDSERCITGWREGLAGQRVFELECRLRRRDGELGWHLCRAVPELGDGDRIVGWLGTFTDCDDLKRACGTAERAVQARDEFLSIASHELRTPLTTLQLRLRSLKNELTGGGQPGAMLRKVDSSLRQGSRLVKLVESLFDLSRITNGRLTLQRERFDLPEAVQEVVDRLAEVAALAGVDVTVEALGAVDGLWDRLRIEQIVENLLSNAIKYAAGGPVTVTVSTCDDIARITVADHGPGIANDDLQRIFEPFERATSTLGYGGLGLGLYIAREYTVAHGGTIAVTSSPGDGATFSVELPRSFVAISSVAGCPERQDAIAKVSKAP